MFPQSLWVYFSSPGTAKKKPLSPPLRGPGTFGSPFLRRGRRFQSPVMRSRMGNAPSPIQVVRGGPEKLERSAARSRRSVPREAFANKQGLRRWQRNPVVVCHWSCHCSLAFLSSIKRPSGENTRLLNMQK